MKGGGWWGTMKWWEKATSSLKTAKWCSSGHFLLYISNKTAKSMAKLTSQSYGNLQLAACLSSRDGAKTSCNKLNAAWATFSINTFKLLCLVNVYGYCVMVKMCTCCLSCMWKAAILKSSHVYSQCYLLGYSTLSFCN